MPVDVFVGAVTHERSRYRQELVEDHLRKLYVDGLGASGLTVQVRINEDDAFAESGQRIGLGVILASAWHQAGVEARWMGYLRARSPRRVRRLGLFCQRLASYLRPVRSRGTWYPAGRQVLTRLANIEMSHLALMADAVQAQSTWTLILEDDAWARDLDVALAEIASVASARKGHAQPLFVNLSASFDHSELGINDLMKPLNLPGWPTSSVVLSADRPVTNTVCAVLYRTSFVELLLEQFHAMGLTPICAIDWKLNAALMAMHGPGSDAGDCWFVEPPPFAQRSMGVCDDS